MKAKPLIVLAAIVIALLGIRILIGRLNQPNDQQLIQQALADSIKASKEGRPGGVMDKLSANLKLNNLEVGGNQRQIAQYIKENQPDVNVINKQAAIAGDQAQISSPVDLELNIFGQKISQRLENVTLVFKREDDREYLIFPTKKWKLAEVHVPEDAIPQFGL
jgi:hypothetical protein